jgi:hypothetical protein
MLKIQKTHILAGLVVMSLANIGWAQVSGGLRSRSSNSSINSLSDLRTFYGNGVSNVASYGGNYSYSQAPSNSILQSSNNYGGSGQLGKPRGLNFGGGLGLTPSYRSGLGGGSSYSSSNNSMYNNGAGNWSLANQSYNPNAAGILSPMEGQADPVILLPMTQQGQYQQQWQNSAEQAIKPFKDKKLQKPSGVKSRSSTGETQEPMFITAQAASVKTFDNQGNLYTAQQLSMARNFVRQGQYDQALNSYQAARTVDSSNSNALVGTIFCHIMTTKLLAGGLNVLALSKQDPDFWQKPPDFSAAFGTSEAQVVQAVTTIEPAIERYMDTYKAQDSKEVAENIRLVHLSKMFLAWLKGDRLSMQVNIEAAAQATPLDAEVQRLCRGIVGTEEQKEIKLQPLKPME